MRRVTPSGKKLWGRALGRIGALLVLVLAAVSVPLKTKRENEDENEDDY
jgi:hypothetical protein